MSRPLRLGTRSSALARAQSRIVAELLARVNVPSQIVAMETSGDRDTLPLPGRGLMGIFVDGVREALHAGEVDVVVHSMKDLPCTDTPGLVRAAIPPREDPRDVLISAHALADLPPGARIGTCSARRSAWVTRTRADLDVQPLRGPIDDRIRQLERGDFDAIILAAAGLNRLGVSGVARREISLRDLVPAPAQGALALECRRGDIRTRRLLGLLDHGPTRWAVTAERAVLAAVDPTDASAVGAIALVREGVLHLRADAVSPGSGQRTVVQRSIPLSSSQESEACRTGLAVADALHSAVDLVRAS